MFAKLLTLSMIIPMFTCGGPQPKDTLVYCSYSRTGAAGLGKEYCELIADPGTEPKVVVAMRVGNRFGDPEIHKEFPVEATVVDSLQAGLERLKVQRLDGYDVEEPITGGYSYRIYMEYSSGRKVNARWYGHKIKDSAIEAYNWIYKYFEPWRGKALSKD